MDVLDDILNTLDLRGALYFRTDFSGPFRAFGETNNSTNQDDGDFLDD